MKRTGFLCAVLAAALLFAPPLDAAKKKGKGKAAKPAPAASSGPKKCAQLDEEFKRKVSDLREKWKMNDEGPERALDATERTLTDMDKNGGAKLRKYADELDAQKKQDIEAAKKEYEKALAQFGKKDDGAKRTFEMEADRYRRKIADLERQKTDTQKEAQRLEEVRGKLEHERSMEDQRLLSEFEKVKMAAEDENRKYRKQIEDEYQKKFDELNAKLGEWDVKEAEKKKETEGFDRQIEEFAMQTAQKLDVFQQDIEKRRAEAEAKFKEAELENAHMALDMELAKESQKLNAEVEKYRKERLEKKKEKELQVKEFLATKEEFRKRNDRLIQLAQQYRDSQLDKKKAEEAKAQERWNADKKRRDEQYERRVQMEYRSKMDALIKKQDKIALDIENERNALVNREGNFKLQTETKEAAIDSEKARIEERYKKTIAKINDKYDRMEVEEKMTQEVVRDELDKKRESLIATREKNKADRQELLYKMKDDYEAQKGSCVK